MVLRHRPGGNSITPWRISAFVMLSRKRFGAAWPLHPMTLSAVSSPWVIMTLNSALDFVRELHGPELLEDDFSIVKCDFDTRTTRI